MEPIIKIRNLTKTYQSKERSGLFGSRVKNVDALKNNGAVLEQIAPTEVTLEDVFIAKTGRTLAEDTRVK